MRSGDHLDVAGPGDNAAMGEAFAATDLGEIRDRNHGAKPLGQHFRIMILNRPRAEERERGVGNSRRFHIC